MHPVKSFGSSIADNNAEVSIYGIDYFYFEMSANRNSLENCNVNKNRRSNNENRKKTARETQKIIAK